MEVRNARLEDMGRLGHIMAVSFRSAFWHIVTPQTLEACAREERCAALLEGVFRSGKIHFLIGEDSAMMCWQPTENGTEIIAVHSLPETWGSGLGHALMEKALEQMGDVTVTLWVFEQNLRARRFYEKHGFRWDGNRRESDFDGAIEVHYVRSVG